MMGHSQIGEVARLSTLAAVEIGEFRGCCLKADGESFDFAQPGVEPGFGDTVAEIGHDLDQSMSLPWVDAQDRAANAPLTELNPHITVVDNRFCSLHRLVEQDVRTLYVATMAAELQGQRPSDHRPLITARPRLWPGA